MAYLHKCPHCGRVYRVDPPPYDVWYYGDWADTRCPNRPHRHTTLRKFAEDVGDTIIPYHLIPLFETVERVSPLEIRYRNFFRELQDINWQIARLFA